MEKFMRKYSFWLTSALGIIALVYLIIRWNDLPMITKLPLMYMIALAVHEIEELKLPGGFVELVTGMTGVEIKNIGVAKFSLLVFTLWETIFPALTSHLVWTVMSTMLIGVIEIFAHLAAARVNTGRFYSPGMITAITVQFPLAMYGFYYMFSRHMVQGIYWLYAAFFLLVPLFGLQAVIVKSNGQKYSEFINNARKAMFSKS